MPVSGLDEIRQELFGAVNNTPQVDGDDPLVSVVVAVDDGHSAAGDAGVVVDLVHDAIMRDH
jgi:hypothetical protein